MLLHNRKLLERTYLALEVQVMASLASAGQVPVQKAKHLEETFLGLEV